MISYHPDKNQPPSHYSKGFKIADTNDVHRIANGIKQYVWSGIVWRGGRRIESHFIHSDWMVLDFDDPDMTLNEALKSFCDCKHIIGTTKSHQKDKGGIVCDRFRVAIPWERRIDDLKTYRFNMKRICDIYPIDNNCKDGARFFFACQDIVSLSCEGYTQEVFAAVKTKKSYKLNRAGVVPTWTLIKLKQVVPLGERSTVFHGVAKDLYRAGISTTDILRRILSSPTYAGRIDNHAMLKLNEAIRSAVKAVERENTDQEADDDRAERR